VKKGEAYKKRGFNKLIMRRGYLNAHDGQRLIIFMLQMFCSMKFHASRLAVT
jgi:hypothetical protein